MQVNNISFGKIVKVNAPYEVAKQIEDIANGSKKAPVRLLKNTETIFNDVSTGSAYTFKYDKLSSYIFSGEEGKKYWDSCVKAIDKIRVVKDSTCNSEERESRTKSIWDSHLDFVYNLINTYGIYKTLDPKVDKNNKIRALNIVG